MTKSRAAARWERLRRRPLNYPEVGASAAEQLPAGYRHVRRTAVIGTGRDVFERAAEQVMRWEVQRGAGLAVTAEAAVAEPGSSVVVRLGPLKAVARVVYTVDEPDRRGFACGTLRGHPEAGEEYFGVRHDPDGTVAVEIVAFSRPATWWSRLGAPVAAMVQDRITERYLAALRPHPAPATE